MSTLLRLIVMFAGQSVQRAGRRAARATALFVVAIVFLAIGITAFSLAGFLLLARVIDPVLAALLVGSLFCLAGAVLLLVVRAQTNPRRRLLGTFEQQRAEQDLTALLGAAGPKVVLLPLVLALLGGYLLASRKK